MFGKRTGGKSSALGCTALALFQVGKREVACPAKAIEMTAIVTPKDDGYWL